jgi:hypothetical protein
MPVSLIIFDVLSRMMKKSLYITTTRKFKVSLNVFVVILLEQAKYLGLLENLRVRRAGYCYRQVDNKIHSLSSRLIKNGFQGTTWCPRRRSQG